MSRGDTSYPSPSRHPPTPGKRGCSSRWPPGGTDRNGKGSLEGRYLSISNHGDYSHDSCCGKQLKACRSTCEEMAGDKINYLHDGWWIKKAATFPSSSFFPLTLPQPPHQWQSRYLIVFGSSWLGFSNMFLIKLQLGGCVFPWCFNFCLRLSCD